jgi:hypothetical protein
VEAAASFYGCGAPGRHLLFFVQVKFNRSVLNGHENIALAGIMCLVDHVYLFFSFSRSLAGWG